MAFDLSTRSKEGIRLAQKFFDFVQNAVGNTKRIEQKGGSLIDEWAGVFDASLKEVSYRHLSDVWDYYVQEYKEKCARDEKPYIYLSPDDFIGDLCIIERRYEWNYRPISEDELGDYLGSLRRVKWFCEWDKLVTAVSKSVYNFRLFFASLSYSKVGEGVKRRIKQFFGDSRSYITQHFLGWRTRKAENVWTATITLGNMFDRCRSFLYSYGYGMRDVEETIRQIKSNIKE